MRIDLWSDVVCPWCFVGLANLETALGEFEHAAHIEVVLHSFQLDPDAPARDDTPIEELLAKKYQAPVEQIRANQARLVAMGAERGIDFRFEDAIRANTFDAHRLLHFAATQGLAMELKHRLGAAYFTEGKLISDPQVLRAEAEAVGLDGDRAQAVLEGDSFGDEVAKDLASAREIGIGGVPFFVFDGRLGLSGAQPAEMLLKVLNQAWSERQPQVVTMASPGDDADGSVCGPDGCELPADAL